MKIVFLGELQMKALVEDSRLANVFERQKMYVRYFHEVFIQQIRRQIRSNYEGTKNDRDESWLDEWLNEAVYLRYTYKEVHVSMYVIECGISEIHF